MGAAGAEAEGEEVEDSTTIVVADRVTVAGVDVAAECVPVYCHGVNLLTFSV